MSCLILYKEGNPKKAKNGYKNGKQVTTGSDALRKMLQKMFLFCMRKIHLVRKVPIYCVVRMQGQQGLGYSGTLLLQVHNRLLSVPS